MIETKDNKGKGKRRGGGRALWSVLSSVSRIINEIREFSGHYSSMSSNAKAKHTHTHLYTINRKCSILC